MSFVLGEARVLVGRHSLLCTMWLLNHSLRIPFLCNYLLGIKFKTLDFCPAKLTIQHGPSHQHFLLLLGLTSLIPHRQSLSSQPYTICGLNEPAASGQALVHAFRTLYFLFPLPRCFPPRIHKSHPLTSFKFLLTHHLPSNGPFMTIL